MDFPAPFGPTTATRSPRRRTKSTPERTARPSTRTVAARTRRRPRLRAACGGVRSGAAAPSTPRRLRPSSGRRRSRSSATVRSLVEVRVAVRARSVDRSLDLVPTPGPDSRPPPPALRTVTLPPRTSATRAISGTSSSSRWVAITTAVPPRSTAETCARKRLAGAARRAPRTPRRARAAPARARARARGAPGAPRRARARGSTGRGGARPRAAPRPPAPAPPAPARSPPRARERPTSEKPERITASTGEVPVVPDVRVLRLGRDEREPLAHADGALRRPVLAVEEPPPGARRVRPEVAAQEPEQRGLPRAARPDDREPLARPHLERHVLEQGRPGEAHVDAVEGDEGGAPRILGRRPHASRFGVTAGPYAERAAAGARRARPAMREPERERRAAPDHARRPRSCRRGAPRCRTRPRGRARSPSPSS